MAQAILHNITPVAKCCILVLLDSSMVGYDDWDGPFVLPTRTRDIRGFGLDFSERLGREPGDEETESIGISERDDFDKTVCMYHHRNAILVLTLEHTHVISAINHSLSSLTRMVLVLHHRKTLRSFEFRPSPPRDLISNESYLGGGVSSLRRCCGNILFWWELLYLICCLGKIFCEFVIELRRCVAHIIQNLVIYIMCVYENV